MPSQEVVMELSQHLCASVSNPWYVYPLIMAQDPLETLVLLFYVIAALKARLCCCLGTLGPQGFCPGLFSLGP